MPIYDDFYTRDLLGETGQYPSNQTASMMKCPDIVVWGTETIPNPQKFLSGEYGTAWYKNVVYGERNFIYCRVKNLFPGNQTGKLYLRYAPGGLTVNISTWRDNLIGTAIPGQDYIELEATRGEVVCGDSSFVWSPPRPIQGGHFCLISQIVTDEHPNHLPERFTDYDQYVRWVAESPAIGWLNVSVVDQTSPPNYQNDFQFDNLTNTWREFLFTMTGTNLPANTVMSMMCGAIGPDPAIDRTTVTSGHRQSQVAQASYLPPNFSSSVTATVRLPAGHSWTGDKTVTIEAYLFETEDDTAYLRSLARPISEIVSADPTFAARHRSVVRLGRYTVQTETVASLSH